ncbi:Peroxisomal 2 [Phytophthora cinnamomi]|uniref:Peroxisomal 2 n=1 Tax=Phytophthora cinnamomi TaxID=4785 RepID=UPI00355A3A85|nr:Peroxisomal 2 [Phytophthora cinnamomi]KAG6587259.1 Peroxisomal 2 [Phytophthora cinnamomi]
MRLYVSRFRALLALVLAISTHHAAEASTCKTLLDSDSTLVQALASWSGTDLSPIDFPTVFKEINTALPWMSKCAAAIDPKAVYTSLASSSTVKKCATAAENINADLSTNEGWSTVCPILEDTLVPCVKSVMADTIMDAFNSAGGCCDDFLSEIKTLFGDSFDDMVMKLLQLSMNVECSERTYTNLQGVSTKEMCAYSIFNSFTFIDSEEVAMDLLMDMLQIPNDQMCNAFAGKEFALTNGSTVTIPFGTKDVNTMGICLEPIDTLMQYLKSWKIFSETLDVDGTSVSLSDLFTSGKSIRGDLLFNYATSATGLPLMGIRATDAVVMAMGGFGEGENSTFLEDWFVSSLNDYISYGKAVQAHIPNNGGCTYSGQSITLPYEEVSTTSSSSGSTASTATTNTTTGTSAKSAASAVKMATVITFGAAILSSVIALL